MMPLFSRNWTIPPGVRQRSGTYSVNKRKRKSRSCGVGYWQEALSLTNQLTNPSSHKPCKSSPASGPRSWKMAVNSGFSPAPGRELENLRIHFSHEPLVCVRYRLEESLRGWLEPCEAPLSPE